MRSSVESGLNQVKIEVVVERNPPLYAFTFSQGVSVSRMARLQETKTRHGDSVGVVIRQAPLFGQRRERTLWRRAGTGRKLRGANRRHDDGVVLLSSWWVDGRSQRQRESEQVSVGVKQRG